jgi:hypothetical protein
MVCGHDVRVIDKYVRSFRVVMRYPDHYVPLVPGMPDAFHAKGWISPEEQGAQKNRRIMDTYTAYTV